MSVALRFIVGDFYSTQRLVRRVAMGLHAAECVCEQIVWQTRTPFAHGRRAAPQNRIFAKIIASLIKGIAMRNAHPLYAQTESIASSTSAAAAAHRQ